jgi:glycosyltransferase involved in cell wall biosynthesis
MSESPGIELSIVLPVHNEAESLPHVHRDLLEALEAMGRSFEVIYCDDGSRDGSLAVLRELAAADPRVGVVVLRRNFGQTAALAAGFDRARGDIVVPMDADLQNDPRDISRLIAKLEEGYDVVGGWRKDRKDNWWRVTLPSRIGNWLIRRVTGVALHDYGCTLAAYRREILEDIHLYGEMHRFMRAYAGAVGARMTELEVTHHPRRWGHSKYSLRKAFRVMLDLLTVRFLLGHATTPLYFFGRLGLMLLVTAGGFWSWTIYKKLDSGEPLYTDPFFPAGLFLALAGLQVIFFGLLSELTMRTYYESQRRKPYVVRETLNLEPERGAEPPARRPGKNPN